jgi:hypothetical protein
VNIHTSTRSALIALAVTTTFALTPASAKAESAAAEYGIGISCVLLNLFYGPAKALYATSGGIVSGLAWAFSGGNADVARPIWDSSLRGDYTLVPDQLLGRRPITFIGRSPEHLEVMEPAPLEDFEDEEVDEGF